MPIIMSHQGDCYDRGLGTPNQTGKCHGSRRRVFDYDCDGNPEQEFDSGGACAGLNLSLNDACILSVAGWNGSVPACGQPGDYLEDNDSCVGAGYINVPLVGPVPTSCTEDPTTIQQACR